MELVPATLFLPPAEITQVVGALKEIEAAVHTVGFQVEYVDTTIGHHLDKLTDAVKDMVSQVFLKIQRGKMVKIRAQLEEPSTRGVAMTMKR